MNIAEKVIDIVKGMEGIGGIPTDEEFLNEFESRLQALKQGQSLPIDNVSKRFCNCKEPIMVYKKDEAASCSDCGGLDQ